MLPIEGRTLASAGGKVQLVGICNDAVAFVLTAVILLQLTLSIPSSPTSLLSHR